MAALREWRHALEVFTETIGPLWAGVAYLLATSRMLAQEFTSDELPEVIKLVKLVTTASVRLLHGSSTLTQSPTLSTSS